MYSIQIFQFTVEKCLSFTLASFNMIGNLKNLSNHTVISVDGIGDIAYSRNCIGGYCVVVDMR